MTGILHSFALYCCRGGNRKVCLWTRWCILFSLTIFSLRIVIWAWSLKWSLWLFHCFSITFNYNFLSRHTTIASLLCGWSFFQELTQEIFSEGSIWISSVCSVAHAMVTRMWWFLCCNEAAPSTHIGLSCPGHIQGGTEYLWEMVIDHGFFGISCSKCTRQTARRLCRPSKFIHYETLDQYISRTEGPTEFWSRYGAYLCRGQLITNHLFEILCHPRM